MQDKDLSTSSTTGWKLGDMLTTCRSCSGYCWLWLVLFVAKWIMKSVLILFVVFIYL